MNKHMNEQTDALALVTGTLQPSILNKDFAQLLLEPRWEGKSSVAARGKKRVWGGSATILTPERVQAAVPGEGGCSRTAEMGRSPGPLSIQDPHPGPP